MSATSKAVARAISREIYMAEAPDLLGAVAAPCNHMAVQVAGLGVSDEDGSEHIHGGDSQFCKGKDLGLLLVTSDVFDPAADSIRAAIL